jgi:hypothetical protein
MTEALDNACTKIAQTLANVAGLKSVPINPPETMSYDTFAVVYPSSGVYNIGPVGTRKGLHNIAVDILTRRVDLARDLARLKPLIDLVANAISQEFSYGGDRFDNSLQTMEQIPYSYIERDYAGVSVIGYHMSIDNAKILTNL